MFKYFSLKGVIYTLKRYWLFLVILTILFGIVGISLPQNTSVTVMEEDKFVSTRSYLVSSENSNADANLEDKDNNANLLIAILSDTSCQYKIISRMTEDYSNTQISKYMGVPVSETYSVKIFEGLLSISSVLNSSIVNITFTSSDKNFSESVVRYYSEYIEENAKNFLSNEAKITPLNEATTVHTIESLDGETVESGSNLKRGVIFALLGTVLSICLCAAIALVMPPISNVKSFEEYGLKVYCRNISKRKSEIKFAEDIIKRDIISCGYKKIAVASSNEKCKNRVLYLLENFKINGVEFISTANITEDFGAFSKLKECDAVILVESEGVTTHNKFEKLISLLSKYDFNIMGIIL